MYFSTCAFTVQRQSHSFVNINMCIFYVKFVFIYFFFFIFPLDFSLNPIRPYYFLHPILPRSVTILLVFKLSTGTQHEGANESTIQHLVFFFFFLFIYLFIGIMPHCAINICTDVFNITNSLGILYIYIYIHFIYILKWRVNRG